MRLRRPRSLDVEALRRIVELLETTEVTRLVLAARRRAAAHHAAATPVTHGRPRRARDAASAPLPPCSRCRRRPGRRRGRRPRPRRRRRAGAEKKGHVVTSPFVGTFYRTPAPDQPSFVEVGSVVKKGQVLCIIEAMKLMNEIEAEVAGQGRRDPGRRTASRWSSASRCSASSRPRAPCSRRSSSPTGARSPCGSSAPAASWASPRWRCTPPPTPTRCTCASPTRRCASARRPRKESYLNIPAILSAAEITRADAIHPGYGFLSENADFAEVCENCKIRFIGPQPARCIRLMGNKVRAREAAKEAGLPLLPGLAGRAQGPSRGARRWPTEIGFPVILKAAAGGGGRGMKIVREPRRGRRRPSPPPRPRRRRRSATATCTSSATWRSRATSRSRSSPTSTATSSTWASASARVQRRHQKLIEESPSPGVSPELREEMGEVARQGDAAHRLQQPRHHRVPDGRARPASTSWR